MSHIHVRLSWAAVVFLLCSVIIAAQENVRLLEPEKPIEQELAGAKTHFYRVSLAAGQFVDVTADQKGIDVVLVLLGTDGKQLLEVDSPSGSRGREVLSFIANVAGTYTIEVRSLSKDSKPGAYAIAINELRNAQPDDRHVVDARKLMADGLRLASDRKPESSAKAIEKYKEASQLFRLVNDKKRRASGIQQVGGLYRSMRKNSEAIESLMEAGLLFEEVGLKRDAATMYSEAGDLSDSYIGGLPYYEKSLALFEAISDKEMIARTLVNVGIAYRDQGKSEQALRLFQRSFDLAMELNNKQIQASALTGMGILSSQQGRNLEALEYYQKAYALSEAIGNKAGMANQLVNIGVANSILGNSAESLAAFDKALTISESSGNKQRAGRLLFNMGNVYKGAGNNIRAMEYYQRSLALSESVGAKDNMAGALINMADLYLTQGNYAQALRHSQRALEVFGDSGYGAVVALNTIGQIYESQGNISEAVVQYQKALSRSEEADLKDESASSLRHLGNAHLAQDKPAQALEFFQRALKLRQATDSKGTLGAEILNGIAKVHLLQQNYSLALEFANRAASVSETTDWESLYIAARAYRRLNEADKARRSYDAAISRIETLRSQVAGGEEERQRFMEGKVRPYQEIISLLVAENKPEEALLYAERSKSRVLLEVLSQGRFNVTRSMTSGERTEEQRLNNYLTSLNSEILKQSQRRDVDQKHLADLRAKLERARLDYEAFRTKLYATHPNLKIHRGELQQFNLREASSLLPDAQTALLEYVVTEDQLFLFVLTKSVSGKTPLPQLRVYPIQISQKSLAQHVATYRQKIATADLDFRASARELYDLLLKPTQDLIRNKKSLIIVPDGVLWELPFQALQGSSQQYVIEEKAISYTPSLTILREVSRGRTKATTSAEKTFLGFGNPAVAAQSQQRVKAVFMDESLEPLPEAEKQVSALALLYGSKQSKVYTGAEAWEERVKSEAPNYRVLHFATHGILNSTTPMYSHLLLSQKGDDTQEDGLLEAWEVMDLNLNVEMVILAACETARGRVGAGEGMIGMSWAFFVAGSPTTVASQWKVESASTTQLMLEFHRNLRTRNQAVRMSKAKALQLAAVKLMKSPEYRHPFYWAGFVLIGDGN